MEPYIIKCKDRLFGTNADNLMMAEEIFIEEYPEFKDEVVIVEKISGEFEWDKVEVF